MANFQGQVSPLYLVKAAEMFSPVKQQSYKKMNVNQGHKVLDVGCGPGFDVMALAELVGPLGKIIGLDYDCNMLKEATQNIRATQRDQIVSLIRGSADQLPFQNNYFDSCRSERLFMHLSVPERTLAEMYRVTKPGGSIVVVDTDWSSLSFDNSLPKIEQALSNFRLTHVLKNGYSGRSLYRQFRNTQLVNINIDVFPIFVTDVDLFYFFAMQQAVEDQALAHQAITGIELKQWRNELNDAAVNDTFYGCANVVMVSANKPGR